MKLKKFLSLLLALVMTASLLTLPAHAEDVGAEEGGTGTTVNFTNVAPLVKADSTSAANAIRKAPLLTAGLTDETADPEPIIGESPDGLEMDKRIISVNQDGSYTIQLEAYTTGSVTTVDTTKPTDIIFVLDQSGSMAWNMTSYTYSEAYPGNNHSGTYYVQSGGSYVPVTWCSGCGAWTDGCSDIFWWHSEGKQYSPKASAEDNETGHVQFYSQTGSKTVIRLDALKNAMTNFAASVADKCAGADNQLGTADDVDHRVAVVGFSSNGYNNTELLTGVTIQQGASHTKLNQTTSGTPYYYPDGYVKNGVLYGSITNEDYEKALLSMNTEAGRTGVKNAINALTAHGGTQTLDGLTMAEEILKNSDGKDRNRVVVLFTDGDTNSTRADVVNKAYVLKNTYNATVYTVGIFEGANGEPPIDSSSAANALMHRISSNYPNATAERGWFGTNYSDGDLNPNLKEGESYYLSASDADALNNIFQKISQQMSESSINLGSTVQIKDIVSPYFNMPADTAAVSVKSYDCTGFSSGEPTWSSTGTTLSDAVNIDPATRAVKVTGFDFNHNFVAENGRDEDDPTKTGTFHGRKLVITFTVTPKDGFWGGNNVPTNGTDSGVYAADGTKIATFDVPTVNVPLEIPDLTASNKNMYLLGTAPTASDLGTFAVPTGDDAWKTAYVDIGPITADRTISNTADTKDIGLSVTVKPKYSGTSAEGTPVEAVTKTATANVNVFTPELTYMDSTAYYGEAVRNTYDANRVSEVWKHGNTESIAVTMFGVKPTLDFTYTPDSTKLDGNKYGKNDVPVKVGVKIGNEDVTAYTEFVHTDCASDCGWTTPNPANGDPAFLVHIKTCTLNITKAGGADDESYVFDVYKDSVKYSEVTVWGNDTETLVELPVGTYTIVEDSNWSWRYDKAPSYTADVVLSSDVPTGTITCTNTKTVNSWLNGFSTVVRNIFGIGKK